MRIETHNGTRYVYAVYRGTEYMIFNCNGEWWLSTQRLSLGCWHVPGGKYYNTLAEVAANCKAFGTVEQLINAVYILPSQRVESV